MNKKIILIILGIIFVVGVVGGVWWYFKESVKNESTDNFSILYDERGYEHAIIMPIKQSSEFLELLEKSAIEQARSSVGGLAVIKLENDDIESLAEFLQEKGTKTIMIYPADWETVGKKLLEKGLQAWTNY